MLGTVTNQLQGISAAGDRRALETLLKSASRAVSCVATATAGLVIKAGGSALAKTGAAAYYATVNGRLVTVAAGVDMPALTGVNITAAYFNVVCFFIDKAGAVTKKAGTEGPSLGAVRFPDFPADQALVGYLIITYASAFTGGTTALDTATTVYHSPVGAFDPSFTF